MKKFVNVREYLNRREEIRVRLNEIADAMEKDSREANDSEKMELDALKREMNVLDLRIASASKEGMVKVESREAAFDKYLRESINTKMNLESVLHREANPADVTAANGVVSTATDVDAMIPLTIGDVIKPLEEGLILKQLGLPMYTGLVGDFVWPSAGAVEAQIAGEGVTLDDKVIDWGKVKPVPQRVGVSITITRETVFKTDGVAYEVVKQQIPEAMWRTLNKAMFNTDANATGLDGAFYSIAKGTAVEISTLKTKAARKAAKYIAFAGELPTYKELLAMKGIVLAKGVAAEKMAYVMDEYTKSQLESTPRDNGSGLMIVEDGKIAGVPVFCTNYINNSTNTFVGFGCWANQPLQQFGEISFIIDPYTKAKQNSIVMTLNADFAIATLREEAFVLGKCAE